MARSGNHMQIVPVADVLVSEGLAAPVINALVPDEVNYTVALMQPCGHIEARHCGGSKSGSRPRSKAVLPISRRRASNGCRSGGHDGIVNRLLKKTEEKPLNSRVYCRLLIFPMSLRDP